MTQNTQSKAIASKADFAIHAVLTISPLWEYWEENEKVEKDKIDKLAHAGVPCAALPWSGGDYRVTPAPPFQDCRCFARRSRWTAQGALLHQES